MKKLYLVISDGGDGSQSIRMTLDETVIDKLRQMEEDNELAECYQSGDGLQVSSITVPDECTLETLGIRYPLTSDDI